MKPITENKMTDKEFLKWIRDRLEYHYNENPRVDYMVKLKQIVDNMEGDIRPIPPTPTGRRV